MDIEVLLLDIINVTRVCNWGRLVCSSSVCEIGPLGYYGESSLLNNRRYHWSNLKHNLKSDKVELKWKRGIEFHLGSFQNLDIDSSEYICIDSGDIVYLYSKWISDLKINLFKYLGNCNEIYHLETLSLNLNSIVFVGDYYEFIIGPWSICILWNDVPGFISNIRNGRLVDLFRV